MLDVQYISKTFLGGVCAAHNLSFQVKRGSVFGLLGLNGAGKTTTLRMIGGIILPDEGHISVNGEALANNKNIVGYLPEERGLYKTMKVNNLFTFFGELRGLPKSTIDKQRNYWLQRLGLKEYEQKKVKELSKGTEQKLQLALTLLHNPDVVILDEPFSGVDAVSVSVFVEVVLELKAAHKMVLISSHRIDEIEKICDDVLFIKKGKNVLSGSVEELKKRFETKELAIWFKQKEEGGLPFWEQKALCEIAQTKEVKDGYALLGFEEEGRIPKIIELVNKHVIINRIERVSPSLKELFIRFAKEEANP